MTSFISKDMHLLKVILLGDGGVGKSCVLKRFIYNKFDATEKTTIGVEFLNKVFVLDGITYTLQIWDTAGQERYQSLRTQFYRGSDICLLTFSVDNNVSFEKLDYWQKEFLNFSDVPTNESFPFVLLGNKCDIPPEHRQVSRERALNWCKRGGCLNLSPEDIGDHPAYAIPYFEVSAQEGVNVEECFKRAVVLWNKWNQSMMSENFRSLRNKDSLQKSIKVRAPLKSEEDSEIVERRWWC